MNYEVGDFTDILFDRRLVYNRDMSKLYLAKMAIYYYVRQY